MNRFSEKILLATDGLESSALATRAAVDLAKGGGAELHVVHVWHTVPSPHYDRVIRSGLEDAGRERLEAQVRRIEEEGGTVAGAHLREGRTVEAIIEQAEEIGAGLIVVGSRGMGRLGRMVMGSVSTGLAYRSPCPVLIVREGEEAWPPERVLVGYGSFEATERARAARHEPRAGPRRRGRTGRGGGRRQHGRRGGRISRHGVGTRVPCRRDRRGRGPAAAGASARRRCATGHPRRPGRSAEADPPELRIEGARPGGSRDGWEGAGPGAGRGEGTDPRHPRTSPGLEGRGSPTRTDRSLGRTVGARSHGWVGGLPAGRRVRCAAGRWYRG